MQENKVAIKETSPEISSLASRVMGGYDPTIGEVRSMTGSLLSQDERLVREGRHQKAGKGNQPRDVVSGLENLSWPPLG